MNRPKAATRKIKRRQFIRRGAAALFVGSGAWARFGEPAWVENTFHNVNLPRLPRAFDGLTIAHLTDIHLDGYTTPQHLAQIVASINAVKPDAVALTGDFLSASSVEVAAQRAPGLRVLSELRASQGKYFVLGNHDYWSDAELVRRELVTAGITDLTNDVKTLRRGTEELHFCGVDDLWSGNTDLPRVLSKLPKTGGAILLMHEPDFADEAARTQRFDLQLSGHSHGGQGRLPFIGPLVLPEYSRKYPMGWYNVNGMRLYTNRGIGTTRFPLRFNCRPEIAFFTLRAT